MEQEKKQKQKKTRETNKLNSMMDKRKSLNEPQNTEKKSGNRIPKRINLKN